MFRFAKSKDKMETVKLHISNKTIVRVLLMTVVTVVGLLAVHKATPTLVLIFTAMFLALALNGPVYALAQRLPGSKKGNRQLATSISFVFVAIIIVAFFASVIPPIVKQTNNFIGAAPEILTQAKDENSGLGKVIRKYKLEKYVDEFSSDLSSRLKSASGTAVATVGKVGSSIFSVLTVLVLTFMMLIEGPRWLRFFKDIIPDQHHERTERLIRDMYKVVKGYVNGQVLLASIAAVLILPMMLALGISYPFALVFIVFICGLIPMVGHTIGAIIVTTIALFTSPFAALIILSYYILYQQIENYFVQPKIQANSTNMSPLLVFMSVIVGAQFGGLFGGLVAIPVAGCLRILALDYLYTKRIIEHPENNPVTDITPNK